jgi:hypothetical protein
MDENYDSILLSGRTISLVGCDNVGSALPSLMRPFGGEMLAHNPWIHPNVFKELGVTPVPLEEYFQKAAAVFVTGAVTMANVGGIGKRYLEFMRSAGMVLLASRAGGSILTNCLTRRPLGKCALELMSGQRSRSRQTIARARRQTPCCKRIARATFRNLAVDGAFRRGRNGADSQWTDAAAVSEGPVGNGRKDTQQTGEMTNTELDFRVGHRVWPKHERLWPNVAHRFSRSGKTE